MSNYGFVPLPQESKERDLAIQAGCLKQRERNVDAKEKEIADWENQLYNWNQENQDWEDNIYYQEGDLKDWEHQLHEQEHMMQRKRQKIQADTESESECTS